MTPDNVRAAVAAKANRGHFATVVFTKKDGTIRHLNGLFRPVSHIKGTMPDRKKPENTIPIWSPRDGWRSFRIDSVMEVR